MPIISQREYDELLQLKEVVSDLQSQLESTKEVKEIAKLNKTIEKQKEELDGQRSAINNLKDEIKALSIVSTK